LKTSSETFICPSLVGGGQQSISQDGGTDVAKSKTCSFQRESSEILDKLATRPRSFPLTWKNPETALRSIRNPTDTPIWTNASYQRVETVNNLLARQICLNADEETVSEFNGQIADCPNPHRM
jgi:hypothetical protein